MNAIVLLAVGGIALMAMAGGKKKPSPKAGEQLGEGEKSTAPPAGGPTKDYRPWEKEETEQPPTTGTGTNKDEVRSRLHAKHLPNGYDIPDGFGDNDAWVSEDCKAFAIGGNFFPAHINNVKETYQQVAQELLGTEDPGLNELVATSHPGEWDARTMIEFAGGVHYDNPGLVWAVSRLPADCSELVPRAENYGDWASYNQAWMAFAATHPALSEFVTAMAEFADEHMGEVWEESGYPDEVYWYPGGDPMTVGEVYDIRTGVRDMLEMHPDFSIADVTDETYARMYSDFDICPKVIEPNNPGHNYCKEIWLFMQELANAYDTEGA